MTLLYNLFLILRHQTNHPIPQTQPFSQPTNLPITPLCPTLNSPQVHVRTGIVVIVCGGARRGLAAGQRQADVPLLVSLADRRLGLALVLCLLLLSCVVVAWVVGQLEELGS